MVEPVSKLDGVLRGANKTEVQPATETPGLQSALETELGAEDTELAKELQRTRAEEIIARRRIAISRMNVNQAAPDTGGTRTPITGEGRGKDWLVDYTTTLLEKGVDPIQVGRLVDYLIGGGNLPPVGMPGNGAPAGGLTFDNMMSFFNMMKENNKPDTTVSTLLNKVVDRLEAVERAAANRPPAEPAKRTAFIIGQDGTISEVALDKPILLSPPKADNGGESIEMIKEKNRHEEEVARLGIDKEHKNSIAQTLASIPEKIGKGLASQALDFGGGDEAAAGAVAKTEETELFECSCGYKMKVPVGATKITCPKCTNTDGTPTVYTREKTA